MLSFDVTMLLIIIVKIMNEKGPLGKPLLPLEQFQRSLLQEQAFLWDNRSVANTALNLLHLPKRVSNIEQFLCINQGLFSVHNDNPFTLLSYILR